MGPVQQAVEKGIQQGFQQGMEKGEDRGRKEVAVALLGEGVAIDIITRSSGLSEEEIRKLTVH